MERPQGVLHRWVVYELSVGVEGGKRKSHHALPRGKRESPDPQRLRDVAGLVDIDETVEDDRRRAALTQELVDHQRSSCCAVTGHGEVLHGRSGKEIL